MDYVRMIAGGFAGAGALILIWKGEISAGVAILSTMVGFFVGERNGAKNAQNA
jgi:hypothetical protein